MQSVDLMRFYAEYFCIKQIIYLHPAIILNAKK